MAGYKKRIKKKRGGTSTPFTSVKKTEDSKVKRVRVNPGGSRHQTKVVTPKLKGTNKVITPKKQTDIKPVKKPKNIVTYGKNKKPVTGSKNKKPVTFKGKEAYKKNKVGSLFRSTK